MTFIKKSTVKAGLKQEKLKLRKPSAEPIQLTNTDLMIRLRQNSDTFANMRFGLITAIKTTKSVILKKSAAKSKRHISAAAL